MDSRLKQRLVGAAVLVALAVIFLPMLVQGPAPDSGISDVPLSMPDAPRGDYETRDLPLVTPGSTPDGGAVGMQAPPAPSSTSAPVDAPVAESVPAPAQSGDGSPGAPVALDNRSSADTPVKPQPLPAASAALPASTAAGDYAVGFGSYGTAAAADAVIASLHAAQLPASREPIALNGKPSWRVRIGPYATRADAESARLRASHVRDDLDARVVVLDAAAPAAAQPPVTKSSSAFPAPGAASTATKPAALPPVPAPAGVASAGTASAGFTIQLAAYSRAAEATALRDQLRAAGFTAFTETVGTDKGTLTRVRVGPVTGRAQADQLKARIKARIGMDGVVRPYP